MSFEVDCGARGPTLAAAARSEIIAMRSVNRARMNMPVNDSLDCFHYTMLMINTTSTF